VLMNFFWIVIPLLLLWQSVQASKRAFVALGKFGKTLEKAQTNGSVHKKKE